MKRLLLFPIFLILLGSAPVIAQEGPYVGVSLIYNKPLGDIKDINPAVGFGLKLGYDFGSVALEGNFIDSTHTDTNPDFGNAEISAFTLDLRIFASPIGDPNQFYFIVGIGSYSIDQAIQGVGTTMDGSGWDFGAGLEHYLNPNLALNFAARYRIIRYDQIESGGVVFSQPTLNGDMWSFEGGMNYYF